MARQLRVTESQLREQLIHKGLQPTRWDNGPHAVYGVHEHPYGKVLVVVSGSITFTLEDRQRMVSMIPPPAGRSDTREVRLGRCGRGGGRGAVATRAVRRASAVGGLRQVVGMIPPPVPRPNGLVTVNDGQLGGGVKASPWKFGRSFRVETVTGPPTAAASR